MTRDRHFADRYVAGGTLAQIATEASTTVYYVKAALRREGIAIRPRGGLLSPRLPTREFVDARRAIFIAERTAGKSMAAIARAHGITRQAVFLALKKVT